MITYKEQFDKMTIAYIKGEVDPLENCACFVGNLLNGHADWCGVRSFDFGRLSPLTTHRLWLEAVECIEKNSDGLYTPQEIVDLESEFLTSIRAEAHKYKIYDALSRMHEKVIAGIALNEQEENFLFIGFEKTLELLKKIHESKGEVIDDAPVFEKRKPLAYV